MVSSVTPSAFSGAGALDLLRTMAAVADDGARFLASASPAVSARIGRGLSADSLFSILGSVAAARDRLVPGAAVTAVVATADARMEGGEPSASTSVTAASVAREGDVDDGPGSQTEAIRRFVSTYTEDNALSSDAIARALLSGGSVGTSSFLFPMATSIADVLAGMRSTSAAQGAIAADAAAWLAGGRRDAPPQANLADGTDADVSGFIAGLRRDSGALLAEADGLERAYRGGTLSLEKASDVRGLDFTESYWMSAFPGGGAGGGTNSCDRDFVVNNPDGKRHDMFTVGLVTLYASW